MDTPYEYLSIYECGIHLSRRNMEFHHPSSPPSLQTNQDEEKRPKLGRTAIRNSSNDRRSSA